MPQRIKVKNSSDPGKAPDAADLQVAELALNVADKKLYSKDVAGNVFEINSSQVSISETAPANPKAGQLWWADSDIDDGGGRLYVWTGDEWVDTSLPGGGSGGGSGDGLTESEANDLYLSKVNDDTAQGALTFEGKTTHEAGVEVTGSGSVTNGLNYFSDQMQLRYKSQSLINLREGRSATDYQVRLTGRQQIDYTPVNDAPVISILPTINGQSSWQTDIFTVKPTLNGTFNSLIGLNLDFKEGIAAGTSITADNFYGIKLSRTNQITAGTGKLYGIYTEVDGAANYNFYAAGNAPNYFAGRTEHAGGVKVTGGSAAGVTDGLLSDANGLRLIHNGAGVLAGNNGLLTSAVSLAGTTAGGNNVKDGVKVSSVFVGTSATASGITSDCDISDFTCSEYRFYSAGTSQGDPDPGKVFGISSCYRAPASTAVGRNNAYGFYTDYAADANKVYGFYAAGDAPNYFRGNIFQGLVTGASAAVRFNGSAEVTNFRIASDTGKILSEPTFNNGVTNTSNYVRLNNNGEFQRVTSSRRYKDNIRDCTLFDGNASEAVKQLQPRTWEEHGSGETIDGFIAEEFFELGGEQMVSFAPWSWEVPTFSTDSEGVETQSGTQRAYRTGNGSTPVTKAAVPMSDDVEVVDGINDRALTILLTKALQETIAKNEELETRLAALEGA